MRNADSVNILIVDDEPKNLAVLESVLTEADYRLVRATSGEAALLALMQEDFALLVLDVQMPTMSGFELAQLIKERKKTAAIPIIFLTAHYSDDKHVMHGYGAGAVDYLTKPVNAPVLRSKVAVFAELHRSNRRLQLEIAERRVAEARLEALNASLDERVRLRTAELQASESRLLEADRRKNEFLATLAHELRNPLAPVSNAVHVLKKEGSMPERLHWAREVIARQVEAMRRLIDDLMDVSRIQRGSVELRCEPLDLARVVEDALEVVQPHVQRAGHRLKVLVPEERITVQADRTRLAQVFVNLLRNACKYTDPGGDIALQAARTDNAVVVSVTDSGIGIPPSRLESIFEMFSQEEPALVRARGGLGIGLALTRQLVQLHGGTIAAFSEGQGRGTCMEVRLPPAPAAV